MKTQIKVALVFVGIIILLCLIYIGYLWLTYIDDTINSGNGYGFNIGESKEQVFEKASKVFQGDSIFILYPIDDQGFGPHNEFKFTSEEYKLIRDRDTWEFYYTTNYFDLIKLTFEQDRLVEIYRHRKKFELP